MLTSTGASLIVALVLSGTPHIVSFTPLGGVLSFSSSSSGSRCSSPPCSQSSTALKAVVLKDQHRRKDFESEEEFVRTKTRTQEAKYLETGDFDAVIGCDEAGVSNLAGPVIGAACYIPPGVHLDGVKDSKLIRRREDRYALYDQIVGTEGVKWATFAIDPERIDKINIHQSVLEATKGCAQALADEFEGQRVMVLVDGKSLPPDLRRSRENIAVRAIVQGDSQELCISAASIIARVTVDRIMKDFHEEYPNYNFAKHVGAPTREHKDNIKRYGASRIHRFSYKPLKGLNKESYLKWWEGAAERASYKGERVGPDEDNAPARAWNAVKERSERV